MNMLHMKYAVEVSKMGSLNKAAKALFVAQPNLSRSIKALESDLGITIFNRSTRGMTLTPEGEKFICYAQNILKHIDDVENLYRKSTDKRQRFFLSVPCDCYISEAFASFLKCIKESPAEIYYKETNLQSTIDNILNNDCNLGVIRYAKNYDKYFKSVLDVKGIEYEDAAEFSYVLLMSEKNPLARNEKITFDDLPGHVEVSHIDPYMPEFPAAEAIKDEIPYSVDHRIFIYERTSQFEALSENFNAFMWTSPLSDKILRRYSLIQRECVSNKKVYKDVLIYRKKYKMTELDKIFINELKKVYISCDSTNITI